MNSLLSYNILEVSNSTKNPNILIAGIIVKVRKLFKSLFDKSGYENDNQYDWVPLLIKKNEEQQKEALLESNNK